MSSEKDLLEPIKIHGQGKCPKCNQANMVLNVYGADHIFLDDYGLPVYNQSLVKEFLVCPNCGFKGTLDQDYIRLEDGSYKWVTEAERIYEEDRMSKLEKPTHLHAEGNPFVKEEV